MELLPASPDRAVLVCSQYIPILFVNRPSSEHDRRICGGVIVAELIPAQTPGQMEGCGRRFDEDADDS